MVKKAIFLNQITFFFAGGGQGCGYEQHISIIQNPRPRRGSMANFAFPELHPKVARVWGKIFSNNFPGQIKTRAGKSNSSNSNKNRLPWKATQRLNSPHTPT